MAFGASDDNVRSVISHDTDLPLVSMEPFIRAAGSLVTKVESNDADNLLSATDLKEVEIWLAAHFYAHFDMQESSTVAGEGEARFQVGQPGKGPLELTMWGRSAMLLDITGYLANLNQDVMKGKRKITFSYLGKRPSLQTDYVDRD